VIMWRRYVFKNVCSCWDPYYPNIYLYDFFVNHFRCHLFFSFAYCKWLWAN